MLSAGSWLCCTSTSLLVSPVVVLAGAAAAEPKSAMSSAFGGVYFVCCGGGRVAVWSLRELWLEVGGKFRRVVVDRAVATQWARFADRARRSLS